MYLINFTINKTEKFIIVIVRKSKQVVLFMNDKEQIVINWIKKNYDTTTIDVIDYTMPFSKIVRTREAKEILVYWDFVKNKVVESSF